MDIDEIMQKPFHIIDILPKRVEEGSAKQYSAVEKYYTSSSRITDVRSRLAGVIIKLSCYYNIAIAESPEEEWQSSPDPELLFSQFRACTGAGQLCVSIGSGEQLIVLDGCDTYMTVYNADEELLEMLGRLAASEGLFLWAGDNT